MQVDKPSDRPFLSIVIPALNEANRLPASLDKIDAFLQQQDYQAEVIIVENGSSDDTVGVVTRFAATHPYVRLFAGEPRGKGRAIRRGMLAAHGEYRFICDADLSMPIEEIARFLPPQLDHYDVAIGSREAKGAKRYNEPIYRHLMGRINNFMVKLLAVRGFEDTQCGFKSFHFKAAEDIFSVSRVNGIGTDVELLYIAQRRGYRIEEVPIDWYYNDDTRMLVVQDSIGIFGEMFEIRRNWKNGLYAKRQPEKK
ncbi:MAG: dolichyl-phosphate beta-glucosyltransferase [Chloroflexota bacterium]